MGPRKITSGFVMEKRLRTTGVSDMLNKHSFISSMIQEEFMNSCSRISLLHIKFKSFTLAKQQIINLLQLTK